MQVHSSEMVITIITALESQFVKTVSQIIIKIKLILGWKRLQVSNLEDVCRELTPNVLREAESIAILNQNQFS